MSCTSQFLSPQTERNSQQQHPTAMRTSCNGCRVLRKGCRKDCSIRPCLEWITSPESQSNATLFLAKFYGRVGLTNLINAGPPHLRPAIFRSLLYEACGRIVNPIYGSVGLLWNGNWQLCQASVEAVLKGQPITKIASSELALKACDIRHVSKGSNSAAFGRLHKAVRRSKSQFKRSARKGKPQAQQALEFMNEFCAATWSCRDSAASCRPSVRVDSGEGGSVSVESVEALSKPDAQAEGNDPALELSLGLTVGDVSVSRPLK